MDEKQQNEDEQNKGDYKLLIDDINNGKGHIHVRDANDSDSNSSQDEDQRRTNAKV